MLLALLLQGAEQVVVLVAELVDVVLGAGGPALGVHVELVQPASRLDLPICL